MIYQTDEIHVSPGKAYTFHMIMFLILTF